MRMTAEVLSSANAYLNPLRQSELGLRGFKIPAFENLGVTEDRYQVLDVSDNEIVKLENFPVLNRLETILASNNQIRSVAPGLGDKLPSLQTLVLSNNKFARLQSLAPLAELKGLRCLSLIGNPVTKVENYRLWVIWKLPQVVLLDFAKVKPQERAAAAKLFSMAEDDAEEGPGDQEASEEAKDLEAQQAEAEAPPSAAVELKQRRAELILKIRQAHSVDEINKLEQELEALGQ